MGSANNIRIHNYPSLEEGNIAFPNAQYSIEHRRGANEAELILKHCIKSAGLIQDLLKSNDAEYACAISSPKTGYRVLYRSPTNEQRLSWNVEECGDPPCFTPMILIVKDTAAPIILNKEHHDVHQVWHNQRLLLRKGSRLAVLPPFRLVNPDLSGMVVFSPDLDMEHGELRAESSGGQDFVFRVYCHPNFLAHIRRFEGGRLASWNIDPLVVTACFSILQKKYAKDNGDEGWKSYSNLRRLAELLEDNDCEHWSYEDFDPLRAATALYPYKWPLEASVDD